MCIDLCSLLCFLLPGISSQCFLAHFSMWRKTHRHQTRQVPWVGAHKTSLFLGHHLCQQNEGPTRIRRCTGETPFPPWRPHIWSHPLLQGFACLDSRAHRKYSIILNICFLPCPAPAQPSTPGHTEKQILHPLPGCTAAWHREPQEAGPHLTVSVLWGEKATFPARDQFQLQLSEAETWSKQHLSPSTNILTYGTF